MRLVGNHVERRNDLLSRLIGGKLLDVYFNIVFRMHVDPRGLITGQPDLSISSCRLSLLKNLHRTAECLKGHAFVRILIRSARGRNLRLIREGIFGHAVNVPLAKQWIRKAQPLPNRKSGVT